MARTTKAEKQAADAEKRAKSARARARRTQEACEEELAQVRRDELVRKVIGKAGGMIGARGLGAWSSKGSYVGQRVQVQKSAVVAGLGYIVAIGSAVATRGPNHISAFAEGVGDSGLYVSQYEAQRNSSRRRQENEETEEVEAELVQETAGLPRPRENSPELAALLEQVRASAFEEGAQAQAEEFERQLRHAEVAGGDPYAEEELVDEHVA